MGDFNVDTHPWTHPTEIPSDYQISMRPILDKMKDMCAINNLELIQIGHTRSQGLKKASSLDVILSNNAKLLTNPILLNSSSDHKVIMIHKTHKVVITGPSIRRARSYCKYSKNNMLQELNLPNINKLLWNWNVESVAENLVFEINKALDVVAPFKNIQLRNNYAPHLSDETKEQMKLRDILKEAFNKTRNSEDLARYHKARNNVLSRQRKDKKEWANGLLGKDPNNSKKLWGTIKTISGTNKDKGINRLIIDGVQVTTPEAIAEGLNVCFSNKIINTINEMPSPDVDLLAELKATAMPRMNEMISMELSEKTLKKYNKEMKCNASNGSDSINGRVLIDIFPSIQRTIHHMINLSLCSGIFPAVFKTTKIAPVLKPGKDPLDPTSYRPVSNICNLGKLIERAQFDQIKEHIRINKLTNRNQHGGLTNHSTTTCLLEIISEANEAKEAKLKAAIIAVDLSSAFDLVSHDLLMEKCRLLALGSGTLKWLASYLGNREHYVDVNGKKSGKIPSGKFGVIQGAQSSGELFLIFLNNLPDLDKITGETKLPPVTKQFVDDINSVIKAKTNEELVTKTMAEYNRIEKVLINHRMKINRDKTQLMYIKPDTELRKKSLQIGSSEIKHQNSIKILGLTISDDLDYEEHLTKGKKNMIKSLSVKNALLKLVKPYISQKSLTLIGSSLINSTILYAAPLWGRTSKSNIQKVQAGQIKAARTISGEKWKKGKKTHRQSILNTLDWPNVQQIILSSSLNIIKKQHAHSHPMI